MGKCLSEQSLREIINGTAPAEQLTRWKRHIRECDSCASRFIKLQAENKNISEKPTSESHKYSNINGIRFNGRLEPNIQIGDFIIEKRIGSGGMGTVYQARQLSLNRRVALKVMSAGMLATPQTVERFHREARAAAKLHHTNIVAIYAEGQEDQTCYYAMELVEGQTLDKIIKGLKESNESSFKTSLIEKLNDSEIDSSNSESSFSSKSSIEKTESKRGYFDTIARLIADVADALDYAHKNGIIHRDIKPSNLILESKGRINLMDFGLARVLEEQSVTVTGSFMGTPNYMSPEQIGAAKQKIDHRTDIYSLGVTLYELLTLKTPFSGETKEQVITQILNKEPTAPRKINSKIPIDLETICFKAMEKEPSQRYQKARQMADDLRRYVNRYVIKAKRAGPVKKVAKFVQRHKVLSCLAVGITLMTVIAVMAGWKYFTYQWVQQTAIPEMRKLIDNVSYAQALSLGQRAEIFAPEDPELMALFSEFTKIVSIDTDPPGADIYYKTYIPPDNKWIKLGKSPVINKRLTFGLYRFRIEKKGYTTLERRSTIQEQMNFTLEKADETPPGMVRVSGGSINLHLTGMSKFNIDMADFYIDRYEVTNKQYKEFVDSGGYQDKSYWTEPIIKDGAEIPFTEAVQDFVDITGQPGPATWTNGNYPEGKDDYPVSGVSWYEAAAYAEFAGKELPTIYHWSKAGLTSGNYAGTILPYSNFNEEGIAAVGEYESFGNYGTYDMAGNVREWCWNEANEGNRYILGGAWNDPQHTFATAIRSDPYDRLSSNGLRCIKNLENNTTRAKALEPVDIEVRDYAKETPISDEIFETYKNILYSYEKTNLNEVITSIEGNLEYWPHESITIDAAYGDERMALHLFLPLNSSPPYQVVIYYPGSAALFLNEFYSRGMPQFILRSGRALLYPILKGTFERRTGLPTNRPDTSETYKDYVIWWVKDICRSIDYLETRDDIQADKIGYWGLSWGAVIASNVAAIEKRIQTCVLVGGGFYFENTRPEVDQINFAPHVQIPVLMLNGRYDTAFPVEKSQKYLFNLLGTDPKDKQHILIEGSHLPKERINEETLNWLDRYLGPVEINQDL